MKLEVVKSRYSIPQLPYELKLARSDCGLLLMLGRAGTFNEALNVPLTNEACRDSNASHLIFKMDFESLVQLRSCLQKMSICCRQSCLEACHKAEQFLFPFENQK
jgi:hypothetical protein